MTLTLTLPMTMTMTMTMSKFYDDVISYYLLHDHDLDHAPDHDLDNDNEYKVL